MYRDAGELFEDLVRGFCPGEWLCVPVVIGDVALDGAFQVGNGFEDAAPDTPPGDGGEKVFDRVQDALHGKFLLF